MTNSKLPRVPHDLRRTADLLEAHYGSNIYARFLREHGRMPSPEQATTMGRIMGARLKADDGKLYPLLTPWQTAERKRGREARRLAREAAERVAGMQDMLTSWCNVRSVANDP